MNRARAKTNRTKLEGQARPEVHATTEALQMTFSHIPDDTSMYEIVLLPGGETYAWRCRVCNEKGVHSVNPDDKGIFRPGFMLRNVRRLFDD